MDFGEDEDYGDELGDQMTDDLFNEADKMGIFDEEKMKQDGDAY